jgi:hypothetical protein
MEARQAQRENLQALHDFEQREAEQVRRDVAGRHAARRMRHAAKLSARQDVLAFTAGVSAIQRHHRNVAVVEMRDERVAVARDRAAFVRAEGEAGRAVATVRRSAALHESLYGATARADIASMEEQGVPSHSATKGIIYNAGVIVGNTTRF